LLTPVETRLQQPTKILPKQKSLVNMKYQLVLFGIGSMVERLLLHAISNFKDLALKKKKLYVTEFYVFRLEAGLLV
jgi:hypothetical protein